MTGNKLFFYPQRLKHILSVFFVFNFLVFTPVHATIHDSIGVEKKDGKLFVLHQVDAKETLYSISKRYAAKVEDIKSANPDMGEGIKIGQVIRIPYKGMLQNVPGIPSSDDSKNYKTHLVEKKETLYSISKKYKVSVDEITKANPGIESGIKEGQTLKIPLDISGSSSSKSKPVIKTGKIHKVEPKETLFGIAKKYNVSVDNIKKANPELIDGLKEGMEIIIPSKSNKHKPAVEEAPAKTVVNEKVKEEEKQEVVVLSQNQPKGEFKKVTEEGMAELLESKSEAPKFQALHRTAPIGTIIQVLNESNGQKIFVRVIGKLVEVSDPKVIIKISQKAMDRLEIKDKAVKVTLTYIP
ncbi:MAG TPA: LysM peptidoglycan-binding domain-containing protein [Cytophagaceae bacterium]|jgi:LysM repeat protein|nr:LysM peptidoglycan-binding domain-containing protein [Cytophagaceae bacterium]